MSVHCHPVRHARYIDRWVVRGHILLRQINK
jgi:hypothetical protein